MEEHSDNYILDINDLTGPHFDDISLPNLASNHAFPDIEDIPPRTNLDYFSISYQEFDTHKEIEKKYENEKKKNKILLDNVQKLKNELQKKNQELAQTNVMKNFLKELTGTLQMKYDSLLEENVTK